MATKTQTIEITNFSGRLTRIQNGDLNSGFARFKDSYGYDPFSKPMNLTWLEQPNNITGPISDLPLAAKTRFESNVQYIYVIGSTGNLYKIDSNPIFGNASVLTADSVVAISSVKNGTTYNYGASMEFFGAPAVIFVGHDNGVNSINFDGTDESPIGITSYYAANVQRPLRQFGGNLLFGNGPTIGAISATKTVVSSVIGMGVRGTTQNLYSQINPPFNPEVNVRDIDLSPELDYVAIAASETPAENLLTTLQDRTAAATSQGYIFKWNGSDESTTAGTQIPAYAVSALQTYLQSNYFFAVDAFGSSVNTLSKKEITLPNNKAPFPNATGVNGNFIFWVCPETIEDNTQRVMSLYYFGALDQENPAGLYRLLRYAPFPKFNYQSPLTIVTNNQYDTLNNSLSSVASVGFGKHYISTFDTSTGPSNTYKLQSFYVTPTGYGIPQAGVYATQIQLFSKKISASQIRVYTEPTAQGNSFQISLVGSDGSRLNPDILSYSFSAGSEITKLQGSLERINFNPAMRTTYALGVVIVNTGTTNMVIKKIEIDITEEGK